MHRRSTKTLLEFGFIMIALLLVMMSIYGSSFSLFLKGSSESKTVSGYYAKTLVIAKIVSLVTTISVVILAVYVVVRWANRI